MTKDDWRLPGMTEMTKNEWYDWDRLSVTGMTRDNHNWDDYDD